MKPVCLALLVLALSGLGAAPPGHAAEAAAVLLRVTQTGADGVALAPPRETLCPQQGCQMAAELKLAGFTLSYNTVITFVADGAYEALTALPPGAARIREFSQARPAPVFVPSTLANGASSKGGTLLRLLIDRASNPLPASGEPDAYLRLELMASPPS